MCVVPSSSDVCMYVAGSTKTNILELTTVLGHQRKFINLPDMNKDNVSSMIGDSLSETLIQHHPDSHLNETQSITHFLSAEMIMGTNDDMLLPKSYASINIDQPQRLRQKQNVLRFSQSALASVISQINNQKVGFDFMTKKQLKYFLTAVFFNIDRSFIVSSIHEGLEIFQQLIVGQSIFVLRHCKSDKEQTLVGKPCLVISTLFMQPSMNDPLSFSIYRLTVLPIVFNDKKYMYSNIPQFIGFTRDERRIITWNDPLDMNECFFSSIVLCTKVPLITFLVNYPCLSDLLSEEIKGNDSCQIVRSTDIQSGMLEIGYGLWLFYKVLGTHYCQIYSASNLLVETIILNTETIVQIPCDKKLVCFSNELSFNACKKQSLTIIPTSLNHLQKKEILQIPVSNTKSRLLSAYRAQTIKSYQDVIYDITSSRSLLRETINEIGYTILSIMSFILLACVIYILRCLKNNFQNDIDNLKELVHDTLLH